MMSLGGEVLDKELKNFCHQAREKRSHFIESYLMHEALAPTMKAKSVPFTEYPVFITSEERDEYMAVGNCNVPNITGTNTLIRIRMVRIVYRI